MTTSTANTGKSSFPVNTIEMDSSSLGSLERDHHHQLIPESRSFYLHRHREQKRQLWTDFDLTSLLGTLWLSEDKVHTI